VALHKYTAGTAQYTRSYTIYTFLSFTLWH